jgi:hypothetical protein
MAPSRGTTKVDIDRGKAPGSWIKHLRHLVAFCIIEDRENIVEDAEELQEQSMSQPKRLSLTS